MSYIIKNLGTETFPGLEKPFTLNYNFGRLFEFWEELAKKKDQALGPLAKLMLKDLEEYSFLKEPFNDEKILEENEEILTKLFYPLFPTLTTLNEIKMVGMPFKPTWFNVTQRFRNIVANAGGTKNITMRMGGDDMMYIFACVWILNVVYDARINFDKTLYFDILNKETGIVRHYRVHFNADFSEIKPNENTIPLTKEDVQELIDNFEDVELWKKKIPPNSYDYEGFAISKLFDVTREEAESVLRYNLLSKNALQSPETIEKIKMNIRSILNLSDIKIGFATYDEELEMLSSMGVGFWDKEKSIQKDLDKGDCFCDHSYSQLFKEKQMIVLPRYGQDAIDNSPLAQRLDKHNLKSYIAAPIIYEGELIGVMELGSTKAEELNAPVANMLKDLIPIFTTALKRSQDELENQLEAIVQDKFTAIHPSVSWRFFEAANKYWQNQLLYDNNEMEEIVFPDVYPLFGQSDIKGSSTERNSAIQADMIEQLNAANDVMNQAIKYQPLPIYKKMKFRIDKYIQKVAKGLGAGDEIKVMDFIKTDVYPIFKHLKKLTPQLKEAVKAYNAQLDDELHIIYKKRKDYEDSVRSINDGIAEYIEEAQISAQKMFPHYFEKYQTDGVEHDMYIGASMVKSKTFSDVYLQNLRLWQMMITCEVENVVYNLQKNLAVPLRVASLILIHSNPITINFRTEEKRFDVDGAYNVRYEIIKKRIDKALIKGTTERLTQVGKIAIIYSQAKEAQEYKGYIEYLQSINYLGPVVEDLDLQDMQGVTGMKALRVEVLYGMNVKANARSKAAVAVR